MAEAAITHPEGKYKIQQVGPSKPWEFTKDGQTIAMTTYSIQIEGIPDWVDLAQKSDAAAPVIGAEIEGHVESDPKYGMRFKKKRGAFSGGKSYSAGAAWANAVQTAATVIGEYAKINPEAAKSITSIETYIARLEQVAPQIKAMVDRLAGADKPAEDNKSESESGVSPAPAPAPGQTPVVTQPSDVNVAVGAGAQLGTW